MLAATGSVINVMDPKYGIAANEDVDATDGIARACADLQAQGGGTLVFAKRRFLVFTKRVPDALASFSALRGVRVEGVNAEIVVGRPLPPRQLPAIFRFTDCEGVGLNDLSVRAATMPWKARDRGPVIAQLRGACTDVTIRNVAGTGCWAILVVERGATSGTSRNITLLDLRATACRYNLAFERSGSGVLASGIVSHDVLRSYIAYGVRDHTVSITSRDNKADDCLLRGYDGMALENIHLSYRNTDSTDAASAAPCVSIAPAWSTLPSERPSAFRSVTVEVDVRYPATGYPGHAISIYKSLGDTDVRLDDRDRGYVFEDMRFSGEVRGNPGPDNSWPFIVRDAKGSARPGGSWGEGDVFSHWTVEDFTCVGTTSCWFGLGALRDSAYLRRVRSDGHVYLSGNERGIITAYACSARSLCAGQRDRSRIDYVDCEILGAENQSYINKHFVNTRVAGRRVS